MNRLAALFLAVQLAGCATYEVAVGVNTSRYMPWAAGSQDGGFAGPFDVVRFTARRDIGEHGFCSLTHISHLSAGWPVNGKSEDWLDMAECGIAFGKQRR